MREFEVEMTNFGSADQEPTTVSLRELEQCQIYLAIFGHRYGFVPEGETSSITHQEYEFAHRLFQEKKMRLLIYLANDRVPMLPKLIEPEWKRLKQEQFRALLMKRHVVQEFDSPDDLAGWVATQLPRLRREIEENIFTGHKGTKVFDVDDMEELRHDFDPPGRERINRIESTLTAIAESFRTVFALDSRPLDVHPIFRELKIRLENIIPGLSLNLEDGILERTGVRHVVLRTESALSLLRHLTPEQRHKAGKDIGIGAANDLVGNMLKERRWVPASPDAFVRLWDFWDSTGGWGKLHLIEEPALYEALTIASPPRHEPIWYIQVENSFLASKDMDMETIHNLSHFWCGYIFGFLDTALPQVTDLMRDLEADQSSKVTLPPFLRVESVIHIKDHNITLDVFGVRFKREVYSEALETLRKAAIFLGQNDCQSSMIMIIHALKSASSVNPSLFSEHLDTISVESRDLIEEITRAATISETTKGEAMKWFESANYFVKVLAEVA
jgi:hypothetical protein